MESLSLGRLRFLTSDYNNDKTSFLEASIFRLSRWMAGEWAKAVFWETTTTPMFFEERSGVIHTPSEGTSPSIEST